MSSIGIKVPITYDSGDGFTMLKTIDETIKQNLKMLILTNPGERVMEPEFGVGIQQFLFSNFSENINSQISNKIKSQVRRYMPAVTVHSINFFGSDPDTNSLSISIQYFVSDIGLSDLLEFTI
jgi:phage baseplate assembly protein W